MECVPPNFKERDTCACIVHENFKLLIKSMHTSGIIQENSDYKVSASLTCALNKNEKCFLRQCDKCKINNITLAMQNVESKNTIVFKKWITKKETTRNGKTKKSMVVTLTSKEDVSMAISEIPLYFNNELEKYMNHVYRQIHQQNYINNLITSLKDDECLVLGDYSQNYICKYSVQAHSAHFGASQKQVTLHTGVLYTKSMTKGFATLSSSLRHDASAAIAHFEEVLNYFSKDILYNIKKLYFLNDGPTTQYRNKTMFYLISQYLPSRFPKICQIIYNFSESGHGKSAADGIGGSLKRMADEAVRYGTDIPNYDTLLDVLKTKSKNIFVSSVSIEAIELIDTFIPNNLKVFVGTKKTHQYTWIRSNPSIIRFNTLSCDKCDVNEKCNHFYQGVLDITNSTKNNDNTFDKIDNSKEVSNKSKAKPKIKFTEILKGNKVIDLKKINKKSKNNSQNINENLKENVNSLILSTNRRSARLKKSSALNELYDYSV